MEIEARIQLELRIVRRLVTDAIAAGRSVTVHDGGEHTVVNSQDARAIMDAVMTTDADTLIITGPDGYCGFARLVYGNDGWDVIADHSESPAMAALLRGATEIADAAEKEFG